MEKANIRKVTWIDRRTREKETNMKKANIKKVIWEHRETREMHIWRFDRPHTAKYVISKFKNDVSNDMINWRIIEVELA